MSNEFKPIGSVERVDGNCFSFTRKYPHGTGTFRGVEGMIIYKNDIIETDINTTVSVLFSLGGRANIDQDSKVEIVDYRKTKVLRSNMHVTMEKFGKKPSAISEMTAGGVMGSRG